MSSINLINIVIFGLIPPNKKSRVIDWWLTAQNWARFERDGLLGGDPNSAQETNHQSSRQTRKPFLFVRIEMTHQLLLYSDYEITCLQRKPFNLLLLARSAYDLLHYTRYFSRYEVQNFITYWTKILAGSDISFRISISEKSRMY